MAKSGSYIPVLLHNESRSKKKDPSIYIEKTIVPILAKARHKYDLSILFLTRKIFLWLAATLRISEHQLARGFGGKIEEKNLSHQKKDRQIIFMPRFSCKNRHDSLLYILTDPFFRSAFIME